MIRRPLAAVAVAALLAGCAGSGGSSGWVGGGGGDPGARWSGPYGSPYHGRAYGYPPGGGYWRGRDYGYRDDHGSYRSPYYRRAHRGDGRLFRPYRSVVCDRATETCYRGGEIDASETRDHFGRSPAREADRIRDRAGTNSIFRPDDGVVCNRRERVCLRDGRPNRAETRDFFGKKAARRVQKGRSNRG